MNGGQDSLEHQPDCLRAHSASHPGKVERCTCGAVGAAIAEKMSVIKGVVDGTVERETRYRYEPTGEIPEGWRHVRNEFNASSFYALWTEAPEGAASPFIDCDFRWIILRQIVQERFVTEWTDTEDRGIR